MPNFNAVAHLVRPAERGQTYIHTDGCTSKDSSTPFNQSGFARKGCALRAHKGDSIRVMILPPTPYNNTPTYILAYPLNYPMGNSDHCTANLDEAY